MNECDCPKPPGGRVVCSDHQLAMCIVDEDGNVTSSCLDRPATVRTRLSFRNWILTEVTGRVRRLSRPLTNRDRLILASGEYQRPKGVRVTFKAPLEGSSSDSSGSGSGSPLGGGTQTGRTPSAL